MAAAVLSRQQRRSSSNRFVDHAADVIKMNLAGTKYPVGETYNLYGHNNYYYGNIHFGQILFSNLCPKKIMAV